MTMQLGECPGRLSSDNGPLVVQFKTLTQYLAVDFMRLENITIFEECLPNHVMLLGCLSQELDVQQWTKTVCQLSQVECPVHISVNAPSFLVALPPADNRCQCLETFAT